jgi:hypothetical protein
MTPSAKEIADGQRACERIEVFQRQRGLTDWLILVLWVVGGGIGEAFNRGGWKLALISGTFWAVVMAISIYQFQRQKKRAAADSVFLADLKARYGASVYAEIEKCPHSLGYNLLHRRFPPFNRRKVNLP